MTAFAKAHPVTSNFWNEVEDVSLLSAALLSLNVEPSALDEALDSTGEPVSLDDLPDDLLPRIEVLRSAVRAGSLTPTVSATDRHGHLDENGTRIRTHDFKAWCDARGIPHNIPGQAVFIPLPPVVVPPSPAAQVPALSQPPYDALPLNGIATMFPLDSDVTANLDTWRGLAKNAKKNGLVVARTIAAVGRQQSTFMPDLVGDWLVAHGKGKWDRAYVDRVLLNNLPPRSVHLKDLAAP